jgi:hypothetical protein
MWAGYGCQSNVLVDRFTCQCQSRAAPEVAFKEARYSSTGSKEAKEGFEHTVLEFRGGGLAKHWNCSQHHASCIMDNKTWLIGSMRYVSSFLYQAILINRKARKVASR